MKKDLNSNGVLALPGTRPALSDLIDLYLAHCSSSVVSMHFLLITITYIVFISLTTWSISGKAGFAATGIKEAV
jgi:hypothetical protein